MILLGVRDLGPGLALKRLTSIDRTSELRKKGFEGRRLGPKQMTTDTAVRVTRMVVHEKRTMRKQPDFLHDPNIAFCSPSGGHSVRRFPRAETRRT